MIELHSHVLYGMDDGSKNIEESMLMLNEYAAQDVTEIACTPHLLPETLSSQQLLTEFLDKRDEAIGTLQNAVQEEGLGILLHSGVELKLSSAIIPILKIKDFLRRLAINEGSYILVELPNVLKGEMHMYDSLLFELRIAGLLPILAHPERLAGSEGVLSTLYEWVVNGSVLLQVNTSSIIENAVQASDKRNHRYKAAVKKMIEAGIVHFAASDAHNCLYRAPQNEPAFHEIMKKYGEQTAVNMMTKNPYGVISDEPIFNI